MLAVPTDVKREESVVAMVAAAGIRLGMPPAKLGLVIIGGEGALVIGGLVSAAIGTSLIGIPPWLLLGLMAGAGMAAGGATQRSRPSRNSSQQRAPWPPITARAIGARKPPPSPIASAIGSMPAIIAIVEGAVAVPMRRSTPSSWMSLRAARVAAACVLQRSRIHAL